MRTRVTRHGDDYVLNGQKRWITNGGVASFYTVFATFDPAMKHKGIACFVVDANTPGRQGGPQREQDGPARVEHDRRDLRGRQDPEEPRSSAPRTAASRSR